MDQLRHDLRYTLRSLARHPGFTLVAVLTIALGVGANTAMFSVVHGVLLRPLEYGDPDRIVALRQTDAQTEATDDVSAANFLDWQAASTSFSAMALAEPYGFDYLSPEGPVALDTWLVSEAFFEVLGRGALLGRTLEPGDFTADRGNVMVIGHGVWRERFGADPGIIGTVLPGEDGGAEVVGVMPPGFEYPRGRPIWTPARYDPETAERNRGANYLNAVGRLAPGVTVERAEAELGAIADRVASEHPGTNTGVGVAVEPLDEHLLGSSRPALLVLLGAVGVLLLIAAANIANLVLARGAGRSGEFAIRSALGARRGALIRQSLTESLVLGTIGGAAGVLVAFWTQSVILAFAPADVPRIDRVGVDAAVLAFAAAVSLLTAVLFGLAPALRFARPDVRQALRPGGRGDTPGARDRLLRDGLVVAQVAIALILLTGAGLVVRSFVSLVRVDRGYRTEGVLTATVQAWDYFSGPDQRRAFAREAVDRLGALPGVTAAGVTSSLPLSEAIGNEHASIEIVGRPEPEGQWPAVRAAAVTSGFFDVLDVQLREGRMLTPDDDADAAPVTLINERFARRWFPGVDPVGRRINVGFGAAPRATEVVGVVGDVREERLEDEPSPALYVPHAQAPTGALTFVVRTAGDPAGWIDPIRATLWEFNDRMPVESVITLEGLLRESLAERRFHLFLLGAFAVLALLLSAVGVYGVLSYNTRRRFREIGIRMALGASAGEVLGQVVRDGAALVGIGLALGLVVTIPASGVIRSMLYGVEPTDPLTYAAVMALLATVAIGAALVPAREATRIDPMDSIRVE